MRIVQVRKGGEEHLGHVVRVDIGQVLEHALIVFPDVLSRFLGGLFGEDFLDDLEFQAAAPEIVGFGGRGAPKALGAVERISFPVCQIDLLFQLVEDPVDALVDTLLEHAVDIERSVELAQSPQGVVKAGRITPGERFLIGGEEEQPL